MILVLRACMCCCGWVQSRGLYLGDWGLGVLLSHSLSDLCCRFLCIGALFSSGGVAQMAAFCAGELGDGVSCPAICESVEQSCCPWSGNLTCKLRMRDRLSLFDIQAPNCKKACRHSALVHVRRVLSGHKRSSHK